MNGAYCECGCVLHAFCYSCVFQQCVMELMLLCDIYWDNSSLNVFQTSRISLCCGFPQTYLNLTGSSIHMSQPRFWKYVRNGIFGTSLLLSICEGLREYSVTDKRISAYRTAQMCWTLHLAFVLRCV
jgi:hypothetical protein